jgi:uncharacterized protein YdeI (YjbR/CyaY-like superfamily)
VARRASRDGTGVWVGLHKKGSGRPSITWPEAVDEALCFGWIDGIRKSVDDDAYAVRFTPRKRTSTWSAVNVKRVAELASEGRMRPAGLAAFEAREEAKTGVYSYEQRHAAKLDPAAERELRANETAWAFFEAQPPSYRRTAVWWVVSGKKEETRRRRLATLIEHSAQGGRIPQLRRPDPTTRP